MAILLTLESLYPIGSVYITTDDNFNPNTAWGGEWKLLESGRSLQTTDSGGGRLIEAGLPNISGYSNTAGLLVDKNTNPIGANSDKGALYPTMERSDGNIYTSSGNPIRSGASTGGFWLGYTTIDASRCSPIYGNSDTVQPPAIKVYAWNRIG